MISIKKLSSNCENCVTKPCQIGCPLDNDIPGFIKEIKEGNYEEAFNVLRKTSILMPVCGRVCPHEKQCQGSCVKGVSYEQVEIGKLETFIGDLWLDKEWKLKAPRKTNHKVAVIGAGPSGLTAAAFLRMNGIKVTIYEKHNYLGGLLYNGIPEFRLPKKIVKKVTKNIIKLGIKVKYNQELGRNLYLKDLKKEYDAVYIAIGANESNKMNVPGEELKCIYGANELLESNKRLRYKGKTIVINGAGNVAMDISRTIKRMGAKKVIVLNRTSRITADDDELEAAKKDGVEVLTETMITKIIGKKKIHAVELAKTEEKILPGEKRATVVPVEGTNYILKVNYLIKAIGSHQTKIVDKLPLEKTAQGRIQIDESGKTSDRKVFSGGDVAGTKGTVAWASRAGRNAAFAIIEYLNKK